MGKLKLGYWNVRALAEPIRYALEVSGEDYEEKLYEMGPGPEFNRGEWATDKTSLGMDFPNLPYIIDGDLKLSEAMACLKYVCRKHGMMPKCDKDMARAENMEGVLLSLRNSFFGQFFVPEEKYEETRKTFREKTFPELMNKIIRFMGSNKWLVSDEVTFVDFKFYTMLKYAECLNPKSTEEFPRLTKYMDDFEAIPAIQKYQSSNRFREYPITAPVARWGFKKE